MPNLPSFSNIEHNWKVLKRNRPKQYVGLVFYFSIDPGKYMWGKVVRHPVSAETGDPQKKSLLCYFYNYVTDDIACPELTEDHLIIPPMLKSTYYFTIGKFVAHHLEPLNQIQSNEQFKIYTNGVMPDDQIEFTNRIWNDKGEEIQDPGLEHLMYESGWHSGVCDIIWDILHGKKSEYIRFEKWKEIHFGKK